MQDLESTIPDGRPAGLSAGRPEKLGIEPATAQLKLGQGLSLEITTTRLSINFFNNS